MKALPTRITSLHNTRIKDVIKLRKRPFRDERNELLIEGYREIRRALDNAVKPHALFYCPEHYLGQNEGDVVTRCADAGAELFECSKQVFEKIAYRDRPEGLLALAPQIHGRLADLRLPDRSLLVVAESVEKPGNLGSVLRSADAAGVNAVIVCDPRTDINNPNVVRSSIGTLFSLPVAEASSEEALKWLGENRIQIVAASPGGEKEYTDVDLTGSTAIVVGTEQYGLSKAWMEAASARVKIPMLGQIDSLNVASATTILLYEAVRQRRKPASAHRADSTTM